MTCLECDCPIQLLSGDPPRIRCARHLEIHERRMQDRARRERASRKPDPLPRPVLRLLSVVAERGEASPATVTGYARVTPEVVREVVASRLLRLTGRGKLRLTAAGKRCG